MNKVLVFFTSLFILVNCQSYVLAQELLSIDAVLSSLEENNYDLKTARQNIESAKVLTSKYNQGYMPTLAVNAGAAYSLSGVRTVFNFNFPDLNIRNIQAFNANIDLSSSYLLYDGGQRNIRNDRNKMNLSATEAQLENLNQQIRFTASQLYYNIAQGLFNVDLLEESLDISRERYRREKTFYQYGNSNKVDLLNAEVDAARDSLSLISMTNDIDNLKWQLNQLTLRKDTEYEVDTSITLLYKLSRLEDLQEVMIEGNKELATLEKNLELIDYDVKLADKLNSPQLSASGAYNIALQKNSSKSQLDFNRNNGLNLGLSASWNILDGGQQKVEQQLVAVDQTTAMLALSSRENELFVQLNTLWNNYQTSLLTIDIERQNIETNKSNFELVKSLYENGQQSSIEFRQAQLNLLTARSQYYNSLVSAKLLEIEIDFLLGR